MKANLREKQKSVQSLEVELMLDSGAFSAWSQRGEINFGDYIKFIQDNEDVLDQYINLDYIAGVRGVPRTLEEIEVNAQRSYNNFVLMKKEGLHPIPVFHGQERWYHLERLLKEGEPYIAVSVHKKAQYLEKVEWLDRVFDILTDKKGAPLVKVHGLGISDFELLSRYPWASCDAVSYMMSAAYGTIWVPRFEAGTPRYNSSPVLLGMSSTLSSSSARGIPHFLSHSWEYQNIISFYLEKEVGVQLDECLHHYLGRVHANIHFMMRFIEELGVVSFDREHGRLF